MNQENWTAVDRYLTDLLVQPDAALDAALEASAAAGLPAISVSPAQGKLLYMLARMVGRGTFWKLARSAVTAPFGWPARCLLMVG